jgi:hypothetical protein
MAYNKEKHIRCELCGKFISQQELNEPTKIIIKEFNSVDKDSPSYAYTHANCSPKISYWLRHI